MCANTSKRFVVVKGKSEAILGAACRYNAQYMHSNQATVHTVRRHYNSAIVSLNEHNQRVKPQQTPHSNTCSSPLRMMTSSNGNIFHVTGHLWGGIHRSPVNSPHKGQWRGALMFSLMCAWINAWVNNREAGYLKRHRAHYDVIVMRTSNRSSALSLISDLYSVRTMTIYLTRLFIFQNAGVYTHNLWYNMSDSKRLKIFHVQIRNS